MLDKVIGKILRDQMDYFALSKELLDIFTDVDITRLVYVRRAYALNFTRKKIDVQEAFRLADKRILVAAGLISDPQYNKEEIKKFYRDMLGMLDSDGVC